MKGIFKLGALVLMVCSLLIFTACSSGSSQTSDKTNTSTNSGQGGTKSTDSGKPKEITFMTISLSPTFDDYINGLIKDFEAQNKGVTVKWKDVPYAQVQQMVLTSASSGNLPDVINLNTLFIKKLAGLGALVNMDQAAADVKDQYFSGIWKSGDVNGIDYAIPWYVTTNGLLYNKDLLKKAGIKTPPTTYAEAWKDSAIIKKKTGAYGLVLEKNMHTYLPLQGVPIVSADGTKATINTPKAVQIWTNLKKYYDDGLIPKDVLLGQAKVPELYAQGKVAFWATGPNLFRQVKDLSPKVYNNSAAAPPLLGDAGHQAASIMNLAVPKSSKNQDIAVKFAEFVTNSDNQLTFDKAANILPSVKQASQSDYFQTLKDSNDPGVKGNYYASQNLSSAVDMTIPTENANDIATEVNDEFLKVLTQNKPVKQALSDAEKKINSLLQK